MGAVELGNIAQVLLGNRCNGDVEDVEVLLANEVEQQIQRPFKVLQDDLQGFGRDEQVFGDVGNGLTKHPSHGWLGL